MDQKNQHENNSEKIRERHRRYYRNNPEKYKVAAKKWQQNNPEKVKASSRTYYQNNPDKIITSVRKWQQKNPGKVKATIRKWQQKNPGKVKAFNKKWQKNNPEKQKAYVKRSNERRKLLHPPIDVSRGWDSRCRKICMEFKAKRPETGGWYDAGEYRCMICEVFITEECVENYTCRCCNGRVRCKARVKNRKKKHLQTLQN